MDHGGFSQRSPTGHEAFRVVVKPNLGLTDLVDSDLVWLNIEISDDRCYFREALEGYIVDMEDVWVGDLPKVRKLVRDSLYKDFS